MPELPPQKITIQPLSNFQPCAQAWREYGVKWGCVTQLPLEAAVEVEARTSEVYKVVITPPRDPVLLSGELQDAGANLNNILLLQMDYGSFFENDIEKCVQILESLFREPTNLTSRGLIVVNLYPPDMGLGKCNLSILTAMSQLAKRHGIAIIGVTE